MRRDGRVPSLSVSGGYTLAMRRNQSHTGCDAILLQQEKKGSRQNVSRWERLMSANIVLQSRDYYFENYEYIMNLAHRQIPSSGMSYEIHCIRGDGTNTT
eukprot:3839730-Pyramimonas_sp.AAC.1